MAGLEDIPILYVENFKSIVQGETGFCIRQEMLSKGRHYLVSEIQSVSLILGIVELDSGNPIEGRYLHTFVVRRVYDKSERETLSSILKTQNPKEHKN